jgi:hypothetical protein
MRVALSTHCSTISQVKWTTYGVSATATSAAASVGGLAQLGRGRLVAEKVGRSEEEHLAHHLGIVLVTAHEGNHAAVGRPLDHGLQTIGASATES